MPNATPEPNTTSLKIPVGDLLKTGKPAPGSQIKMQGFNVQIVNEKAKVENGKMTVKIHYLPSQEPGPTGAILVNFNVACVKCAAKPVGYSGSSGGSILGNKGQPPQPLETSVTFDYTPDVTEVELGVDRIMFLLNGPWELNIPMQQG